MDWNIQSLEYFHLCLEKSFIFLRWSRGEKEKVRDTLFFSPRFAALQWIACCKVQSTVFAGPFGWSFLSSKGYLMWIEIAQSCPTLCNPMNCSLPRSSVHGIFQTRVLEWVAISFHMGSSQPRDQTQVSRIAGRCFTIWATREAHLMYQEVYYSNVKASCMCTCGAKSPQSCPTLCTLPDSSVHGILPAKTLKWVAMPSSGGIFPTQGSNPVS